MAEDDMGRHLSLGDLEVSGCCFSKKISKPVGRRWLIAIINMIEMKPIDWRRKSSDKKRWHKKWKCII